MSSSCTQQERRTCNAVKNLDDALLALVLECGNDTLNCACSADRERLERNGLLVGAQQEASMTLSSQQDHGALASWHELMHSQCCAYWQLDWRGLQQHRMFIEVSSEVSRACWLHTLHLPFAPLIYDENQPHLLDGAVDERMILVTQRFHKLLP